MLDLLGDIGLLAAVALPELMKTLNDHDPNVRRYAFEAIGTAQGSQVEASLLTDALSDEDALVRRNAAMTIAGLGPNLDDDETFVSLLAENPYFWRHHVRGWSIEAPQRLTSPKAPQEALRYLMTTRWDHTPKSGDTPPDAHTSKHVVSSATV